MFYAISASEDPVGFSNVLIFPSSFAGFFFLMWCMAIYCTVVSFPSRPESGISKEIFPFCGKWQRL